MIVDWLPNLLLAWSIHAVALMTPGPNVLAVIGTAMASGRRPALAMSLGMATGTALWSTMTVVGLAALIAAYAGTLVAIKIYGALYLAWLAIRSFRSAAKVKDDLPTLALSGGPGRLYRRGLILQMSNPKAALSWIATVSIGLGGSAPLPVALCFIAVAVAISAAIHSAYALAFSTRPAVRLYLGARRWIEGLLGVLFAFAAFKLATSRI